MRRKRRRPERSRLTSAHDGECFFFLSRSQRVLRERVSVHRGSQPLGRAVTMRWDFRRGFGLLGGRGLRGGVQALQPRLGLRVRSRRVVQQHRIQQLRQIVQQRAQFRLDSRGDRVVFLP
jgi:hypothetical protein